MMLLLQICLYVLSFTALVLLTWLDPRRRVAARSHPLPKRKIASWQHGILIVLVLLPLWHALWLQHWVNALIAIGFILVTGWGLALRFAVQR